MSNELQRFRVVKGDGKPKSYRARKRGEVEQLTCQVCEAETGVATSLTYEGQASPMIADGKLIDSTPGLYCVHCLSRGKVTRLL
ncbi:hypothetical protein [Hoeflea poritis]|uniref:Uncharacterized protein n=1 Tax=Hoeflea poritis TaxID=2993659 RepID=A0ABT4VTK3_9HYPH|nr:hypothetical protein [Hoeflea poritis]MDA4848024.1 hypothetical protein [Hoeflea poritis]